MSISWRETLTRGSRQTIGARRAIDLLLHLAGDPVQEALGIMVLFKIAPDAQVLASLRLRKAPDLDEVSNHA